MSVSSLGGHLRPHRIPQLFIFLSGILLFFVTVFFLLSQTASAAPRAGDSAKWIDANTIQVGDSKFKYETGTKWRFTYTETRTSSGGGILGGGSSKCTSTISFSEDPYSNNGGSQAKITILKPAAVGACTTDGEPNTAISITNASAVQGKTVARETTDEETDEEAGATGKPEDCNTTFNPLTWIVCPIVDNAFTLIDKLDNVINTLLTVDTRSIFNTNTDTGKSYYAVWNSFRLIALGLIVIVALIIIIATAFGLEILDAYTIRKALPRVLLALLLIVLSWPILNFLITLSNDIGNLVRYLIYAPFAESFETLRLDNGTLGVFNILLTGGIIALGLFGLLSFGVTALIAALVAFLVLVIREMIIILLVMLAPVAFACMILPNTQKVWQLWQNTFTAMLVAFPIIAAMIAMGRVFSVVAYNNGDAGTVDDIIAFVAYFLPYFLLPLAFRLAGGMMATLAGVANSSERGMFDRLKKYRQGKSAQNMAAMKSGTRFQEHGGRFLGAPTRGFNRVTSGAALGVKGRFGVGQRGQEARDIASRNAMADLQKTPGWNAIQEDDDALRAATYSSASAARRALYDRGIATATNRLDGRLARNEIDQQQYNELLARARLDEGANADRAVKAVQSSIGFGRPQAIAAAQQLGATGTGYKDLDDMTETVARAAGGNTSSGAAMSGYLNFVNKQKGRHDLAPGAGNVINDVHSKMGVAGVSKKDTKAQMQEAWNSGSLYQIANGKNAAMKNFTKHHLEMLNSNNVKDRQNAAVAFAEMQNMLPSASGANQQTIVDAMRKAGIDYNSDMPIEQQIVNRANKLATGAEGPAVITAADLRGSARVYDREEMRTRQASGDA